MFPQVDIVHHKAKSWDELHLSNATKVFLTSTNIAAKIYLTNIQNIDTSRSKSLKYGFKFLEILNCSAIELNFPSVEELHVKHSKVNIIRGKSLNELDILDNSHVKNLTVHIKKSRSSFRNSTIDVIHYLKIEAGSNHFTADDMKIGRIKNLEYTGKGKKAEILNSYIETIDENAIVVKNIDNSTPAEFFVGDTTIDYLTSNGFKSEGRLEITQCVIHDASQRGIELHGAGSLSLSNVTVNGGLNVSLRLSTVAGASVHPFQQVFHFGNWPIEAIIVAALLGAVVILLLSFVIVLWLKRNATNNRSSFDDNMQTNKSKAKNMYSQSLTSIKSNQNENACSNLTENGTNFSQSKTEPSYDTLDLSTGNRVDHSDKLPLSQGFQNAQTNQMPGITENKENMSVAYSDRKESVSFLHGNNDGKETNLPLAPPPPGKPKPTLPMQSRSQGQPPNTKKPSQPTVPKPFAPANLPQSAESKFSKELNSQINNRPAAPPAKTNVQPSGRPFAPSNLAASRSKDGFPGKPNQKPPVSLPGSKPRLPPPPPHSVKAGSSPFTFPVQQPGSDDIYDDNLEDEDIYGGEEDLFKT